MLTRVTIRASLNAPLPDLRVAATRLDMYTIPYVMHVSLLLTLYSIKSFRGFPFLLLFQNPKTPFFHFSLLYILLSFSSFFFYFSSSLTAN